MHIEFFNHSSLLVSHGAIQLLMDYWHDGTAFDDSWKLLCEPSFDHERLQNVTHIWFSHEHPDHFSPGNIKRIPVEYRRKIVVLFQQTTDKRVVSFCRKAEFRDVVELSPGESYELEPGVRVTCSPYGSDWGQVDSWLLVETPGCNLLNINDCEIHTAEELQAICKRVHSIDVFAVQFSYASKQGERDDEGWPSRTRDGHLAMLTRKVKAARPVYTIPFASFVYWCHRESRYLNRGIVRVHDAANTISAAGSTPVVLYPGDCWTVGEAHDNSVALARYAERYAWCESLPDDAFVQARLVEPTALIEAAETFLRRMKASGTRKQLCQYLVWRTTALPSSDTAALGRWVGAAKALIAIMLGRYPPSKIYVDDHAKAYEFSFDGMREVSAARDACDVALGSAALHYCFTTAWGGETLQINGRFDNVSQGGWARLREVFFLARRIEQGYRLPRSMLLAMLARRLHATA